ncbi:hypothetical protein ZIOFF_003292 [Zingiber officinale]|uniref:Uncharacterized protein n=1 Tax=Zingiber officinale TaxID=94328 RepID=A0A8J5ID24_ZINOF|nr:hypothetical protein ZIOFF_003292 [Zingiber officinale]
MRYLPLSQVFSSSVPCVCPSGSSSIVSKKVNARMTGESTGGGEEAGWKDKPSDVEPVGMCNCCTVLQIAVVLVGMQFDAILFLRMASVSLAGFGFHCKYLFRLEIEGIDPHALIGLECKAINSHDCLSIQLNDFCGYQLLTEPFQVLWPIDDDWETVITHQGDRCRRKKRALSRRLLASRSSINQSTIGAVKKLMGAEFSSILLRRFDSSKWLVSLPSALLFLSPLFSLQNLELRSIVWVLCSKAEARMAIARIKLLRNKREAQVRQMRRDVALLLESGRDETARIRVRTWFEEFPQRNTLLQVFYLYRDHEVMLVEHVIREQNVMAANDIIELFCELIVARLPIIAKQRDCPQDLKEGISSLIYASPRCSDIPELSRILLIFEKKYGKAFVSAATELRPKSEVNCLFPCPTSKNWKSPTQV